MVRVVSIFFLIFLFCDCYAQHKEQSVKGHKYELFFYPSGSPKNVMYSIIVNEDSIKAENHRPTKRNKKPRYVGKLSFQERAKLDSLYNKIDTVPVIITNPSEDTWAVSLFVDNKKIFEDDDFSFKSPPPDIRKLIEYLIKIGVIKIELYGFA